jgi:hypothetical protein
MVKMDSQRRRGRCPEDLMKTSDQISSGDTMERPLPGTSDGKDARAGSTASPQDIGVVAQFPEHPRQPERLREEIAYAAPAPDLTARLRDGDVNESQRQRRPSRVPLLISGLALGVSLVALGGPAAKPWVEKYVSVPPRYAFLLGDSGVAALAARTDDAERRVAAVAGRVDAIEAVGGNVNVAALRIERLERAGTANDSRLGELAARLDALAARIDAGEARLNAAASLDQVNERGGAVQSNLNALAAEQDKRVALVEASLAASRADLAVAQAELSTLAGRLNEAARTAEASVATAVDELRHADQARSKTTRMALAVQQLGAKLQTSRPFEREIDLIRRLSAGNPAFAETVAVLGQSAGTGVATLSELRESYNALVAPRILTAVTATTQRGLGDRVGAWLESVAEAAGAEQPRTASPEQQTIEATARRLAESDLKGAVELISRMGAPASIVARRWLLEANARLAVDEATAALLTLTLDPMTEG